jgi:hypothetical protein
MADVIGVLKWSILMQAEFKKVTVNLPTDQVEFLQSLAMKEKISVVDVLRRAINSEKFFVENETAKRKVLIEDGDRIREVIRK